MAPRSRPLAPHLAVKLMALVCIGLALMCVGLAVAWTRERNLAACWRAAAEYRMENDLGCES